MYTYTSHLYRTSEDTRGTYLRRLKKYFSDSEKHHNRHTFAC